MNININRTYELQGYSDLTIYNACNIWAGYLGGPNKHAYFSEKVIDSLVKYYDLYTATINNGTLIIHIQLS